MRCTACNTDNPNAATACQSCGAALPPAPARRRRRNDSRDVADSPRTLEYDREVKGIFNLCLVSLVPFLGLVLGPLGAWRGWRLLRRARLDPAFIAARGAQAAVILGSLTGVTNWLGLGLMVLGLLNW